MLRAPGTFVFVARLGLQLYGAGTVEEESCQNGNCAPKLNTDFDDKSPVALGVDGLFHATRGLRLGLGYWLLPSSVVGLEPNRGNTVHLGSEHALNAIVEGIAPLRPNLALALRAQGGPRLLLGGGDLVDGVDSFLAVCSNRPVDRCNADKGPFFGGQFGTSVGLLFGDRLRTRVDLGVERSFVKAGESQITDGAITLSSTATNFATRIWAMAGVEL